MMILKKQKMMNSKTKNDVDKLQDDDEEEYDINDHRNEDKGVKEDYFQGKDRFPG